MWEHPHGSTNFTTQHIPSSFTPHIQHPLFLAAALSTLCSRNGPNVPHQQPVVVHLTTPTTLPNKRAGFTGLKKNVTCSIYDCTVSDVELHLHPFDVVWLKRSVTIQIVFGVSSHTSSSGSFSSHKIMCTCGEPLCWNSIRKK